MTMFYMDFSLQAQASRPKLAGQREGPKNREDHLNTAGATGTNRTLFAASFFRDRISFCWHQHICWNQVVEPLLPLIEFQAFLRKSLENSRGSIYTTWNCSRQDSQYQQGEVQDWAPHLKNYYQVWCWQSSKKAWPGSILSREASAFDQGLVPSINPAP